MSEKICPIMSGPTQRGTIAGWEWMPCQKEKCALWIIPESTEGFLQPGGCALALQPMMIDGLLRV